MKHDPVKTSPETRGHLQRALQFLKLAAVVLPPRHIPLTCNRPVAIVYTDAMFTPGKPSGLSYVLRLPNGTVIAAPMIASVEELAFFLPRRTQINQLEALALLAVVFNLKDALRHMDLLAFIDNQGALAAVISGYSKNADAADVVCMLHLLLASADIRLWAEWVDSAANVADELSRNPEAMQPKWLLGPNRVPELQVLGKWSLQTLWDAFSSARAV